MLLIHNYWLLCLKLYIKRFWNFRNYITVRLDPIGSSQEDPDWEFYDGGKEIVQKLNSDPGLTIGS